MDKSNSRRKHVCILPNNIPLSSRPNSLPNQFLRLPHPRTRLPTLYLPFVEDEDKGRVDGLLEVQRVTPEEENKRCWFVGEEILSDGTLTILTPFDPIFLLISLLSLLPTHYLSYEDLWESLATIGIPIGSIETDVKEEEVDERERDESMGDDILKLKELNCVEKRLNSICETQLHESMTLYRLSLSLVTELLKKKVNSLTDPETGIFGPLASITLGGTKKEVEVEVEKVGKVEAEDAVEVVAVEVKDTFVKPEYPTVSRGLAKEGLGDGQGVSLEIQMETRTKSALLILRNYLLPEITHALSASYSFKALNEHLSTICTSSVLSTTYLPGRGSSNPDGASSNGFGSAAAKEKKRKADARGSRGVEELKKVNTKGMKSIAEMFKLGPKKK